MYEFMLAHPFVGAVAPQLVDTNGVIQDSARNYVTLARIIGRQIERIVTRKELRYERSMNYTKVQTKDWVIGAYIMVSRDAYEVTGGLDNRVFMYAEELEWGARIREQGLEVVDDAKVKVTYKGTRRARHSIKYAMIFLKSHLMYWRKFGFFFGFPERQEMNFEND